MIYWDYSWNPIVMRCSKVSAGCLNCWHLRMCDRMRDNPSIPMWKREIYAGDAPPKIDENILFKLPRKPSVVAVQWMGDLFHDSISNEMISYVWLQMIKHVEHAFLLLTKRIFNLQNWINKQGENFPEIKNIWIGASVEDQESEDLRVPMLLNVKSAHRWISVEPVIGSISFDHPVKSRYGHVDWVVAGAETGPGARQCDPGWLRTIRDQCKASRVPFLLKQVDSKWNRELDGVEHTEFPW